MNETPSASAIIAPIWERKWLILAAALIVAFGTYIYYKSQPSVWRVETKLYLAGGAEEGEKASGKAAAEAMASQPTIINAVVVESVHRLLRKEGSSVATVAAKGKVTAKSAEKSDFITITTETHSPAAAALLANTVAATYIRRQHLQYEKGIYNQLVIAHKQLRKLETPDALVPGAKSKGPATVSQSSVIRQAQLISHIQQLESELGQQQVQQLALARSTRAELLSPKPKRNAAFGFVIGLLLASLAAFLLARLDRRLRVIGDVEAVFHSQILAVLPEVRHPIVFDGAVRPSRVLIEPLRLLRTTLQLNLTPAGERQERPRSLLFLSADAGDGRSTVVADLALVQREAGERAAVVEADFRHPTQATMLGLADHSGLAEVLVGSLTLEEALQTVPAAVPGAYAGQPRTGAEAPTALATPEQGAVLVLPGRASAWANPPALLSSAPMGEVLHSLSGECDHVLIDVPSPLEYSDAMPLLAAVDGIVIVARLGHTRERSAVRLRQLLERTPSAPVLGVVANGVPPREVERYGMSAGGPRRDWLSRLTGR